MPIYKRFISVVACMLALSACGGGASEQSSDAAKTPTTLGPSATTTTTAPPVTSSPTQTNSAKVGATITDAELGHVVKVKNVVRNFPGVPDRYPAFKSKEVVLVEIEAEAGTRFSGSISPISFRIVTPESATNLSTSVLNPQLEAANYKPFLTMGAKSGETVTGWMAFTVEPNSSTLTLRYIRPASKVIGESQTIPEKNFDITLLK